MVGDVECVRSVDVERSRHRDHRLRMLGMLHDSVANDLVGAILRCRTIVSRQSVDASVLAEICEIEDILERSLVRLREDIIIPERIALGNSQNSIDSRPEHTTKQKTIPKKSIGS